MTNTKTILADGKDHSVRLERFDQCIEPGGPGYHGYYVTIEGHGLTVKARTYDGESEMSIQSGIEESDSDAIARVRDIARQLFGIDQLTLLTRDSRAPYRKV